MGWHFGRYTETVAAAGKAAYPLPLYVNAALPRPGKAPGEYPSAGPLPHLHEIWRLAAPSIDLMAPDIYFPSFTRWADAFTRPGNPLFIPEANRAGASEASANALYAFGKDRAIGFSPFSIDSIADPAGEPLGQTYAVLDALAPLILEHQAKGAIAGARPAVAFDGSVSDAPMVLTLGRNRLTVTPVDPWTPRDKQRIEDHGGLVLQLDKDEYLVAGTGITITFAAADGSGDTVGIETIREGEMVAGEWRPGRLLNGDESHQGRHLRLPPGPVGIQRVKLYRYR
jgi:beta-galactosidase GanA